MPLHPTRFTRLAALVASTAALSFGAAPALADPPSRSQAGGEPAADHTARDDHRPAGVGQGRKIGK